MTRSTLSFGLGLATALAAGWFAFPRVLYVREAQPVEFRHKVHAEKSGVSGCGDCHILGADGSFAGIPRTEACAACHAEKMGGSPSEAKLVDSYIKAARETPWLVYSRQPANVWFSHAIHTRRAGLKCAECHGAYGESGDPPLYQLDRISTYSRGVMDMSRCEDCHHQRHVEVSCLGCHE